jgi:SAM-dependent methyltransferase
MQDDILTYLTGARLYGDDFSLAEIEEWFADEAEGYAELGAKNKTDYLYVYHELNSLHGIRYIQNMKFNEALGLGSAYGDEFKPISKNIKKITVLEPSDAFSDVNHISNTPCQYVKPRFDGRIPFEDNRFDLIMSLGVMHHIPNVSYVMSEGYRCLNIGGVMLLREPIVSMGDWRVARRGLTKRERGLPVKILNGIIKQNGFKIIHKSYCMFPLTIKLAHAINVVPFNDVIFTRIDAILSRLFSWNITYYRTKFHQKFAPASIFCVLEK